MANNKLTRLPIQTDDLLDLTPTLMRFLGYYCTTNFDETSAYKKTWPAKAKDMSSAEIRLESLNVLNNRSVKIAVERFVSSVLDPYRDKLEHQVLNVLRNQAFYDIGDFFNPDGSVKTLDKIDYDKRQAIESISKDYKGGRGEVALVNYKLADKRQAIKMLTELLRKADGDGNGVEVTDDHRKRVSDIMAGAMAGMKAERESRKEDEPKPAPKPVKEKDIEDAEFEEYDSNNPNDIKSLEFRIENSPIVLKAKELANKQTAGMDVENHELVVRARGVAKKTIK